MCGSCGTQGIGSPAHLEPFSLLGWTDLKVFTASVLMPKYFSTAVHRYSPFGGFHAPTDVMESGHVLPEVVWSLIQLPWPKCRCIHGGFFEHLPSGDGFLQPGMDTQPSPRTSPPLFQTPVGHLTLILFFVYMLSQ